MQLVGLALLAVVIWFGFQPREPSGLSAFDIHAFVIAIGGSLSAILVSSNAITALRTATLLREIIPLAGSLRPTTDAIEAERVQFTALWREGRRAQAVQPAEESRYDATKAMLELVMSRAPDEATAAAFLELKDAEMLRYQPGIANWELLSKLAPSFGMVGTITGMIQLFRTLGDDTNMGAALSLALLSTLYGVAFGAGMAGPVGHYLRGLLDERIAALDRCEKSVSELVARSGQALAVGG